MMKRKLFAVMFSGLALVAMPILGCGETDDPSAQNNDENNGNGNNNGNNNGNGSNNTNNNNTNNNTNNDNDNGPDCTLDSDCVADYGAGATCNDDNECEAAGEIEYDCDASLTAWFNGQITDDEVDNAGGVPLDGTLDHSAGLGVVQEALDAAWEADGEEYDPDATSPNVAVAELPGGSVDIEGATITAVGFPSTNRLWIQDGDAALKINRLTDEDGLDEEPHVGQRVNFTVDLAEVYNGDPSIREFSNWEVIDDGGENDVPYIDTANQEIDREEHFSKVVRVVGKLTDDWYECGGPRCYEMLYGDEGQYSTTFRTNSQFDEPGTCVTFVGPVTTFPAFYREGAAVQLEPSNWDWSYSMDGGGGLDD